MHVAGVRYSVFMKLASFIIIIIVFVECAVWMFLFNVKNSEDEDSASHFSFQVVRTLYDNQPCSVFLQGQFIPP